ncbi:T9SS type A sorting domain-containing protein [Winogradskyella pulchriflava]|uniref:T9SS type A sorting domain-containing protein n=1 Tax=Winogradskyella pulchriflava TaxID=1110688 RepID=A0ABV6Q6A9_9FLAO
MKKITLILVCLFSTLFVAAQWNTDTAINTLVADADSSVPRSIVGSDGSTYIVFWKELPSPDNYELRIQKLDAMGNQLFGTEGKLISNTMPMSSFTQVKSVAIDANDNIYVGATATSGNGGYAFKVDSNGNNQWTSDGISLGTAYIVRMWPLSNGEVIISMLNGSSYNGEMQKYSANGTPVWATPTAVESLSAPANIYEMSNGDVVCLYHKLGSGVTSTIYAQRFNSTGASVWASPTQLFSSNNNTVYNVIYYGAQDGDVVYYSYKLAHDSRFDAYVQRINPDGTLPWGINGVDFDTNQTNYEQEIQIALTPGSQYVYALCRYTDSGQGNVGIYLQKFDKVTGARMLTDNAKAVYSMGSGVNPLGDFRVTNDHPVFLTSLGNNLDMVLLDSNGDFVWTEESKPVATFAAAKSNVNLHAKSNNEFVITFLEDKGSGSRVYAQNFTDAALSIDDVNSTSALQFTNPITNELKLKSSNTINSAQVYNTLGQLVYKTTNNSHNELTVNSQDWNPGMYLVIVSAENGNTQTLKIIKK